MTGAELEILYEDDDLLATNKPRGVLVEGGGEREVDLEVLVGERVGRRVWCCHRLDRLTSGVVLLRKTARFRTELAALFENRQIRKEYWALVEGLWDKRLQKVETRIAPVGGGLWVNVEQRGKPAVSTVQVLGQSEVTCRSWLRLLLKTGRTHQARLHCLRGGCPVVGDPLYGSSSPCGFFGLHARQLSFRHPGSGQPLELVAPVSADWERELEGLRQR